MAEYLITSSYVLRNGTEFLFSKHSSSCDFSQEYLSVHFVISFLFLSTWLRWFRDIRRSSWLNGLMLCWCWYIWVDGEGVLIDAVSGSLMYFGESISSVELFIHSFSSILRRLDREFELVMLEVFVLKYWVDGDGVLMNLSMASCTVISFPGQAMLKTLLVHQVHVERRLQKIWKTQLICFTHSFLGFVCVEATDTFLDSAYVAILLFDWLSWLPILAHRTYLPSYHKGRFLAYFFA